MSVTQLTPSPSLTINLPKCRHRALTPHLILTRRPLTPHLSLFLCFFLCPFISTLLLSFISFTQVINPFSLMHSPTPTFHAPATDRTYPSCFSLNVFVSAGSNPLYGLCLIKSHVTPVLSHKHSFSINLAWFSAQGRRVHQVGAVSACASET